MARDEGVAGGEEMAGSLLVGWVWLSMQAHTVYLVVFFCFLFFPIFVGLMHPPALGWNSYPGSFDYKKKSLQCKVSLYGPCR